MGRNRSLHYGIAAALCVFAACAPKQKIPLDCIPEEVTVYVDGERLDELPPEISLRSDEPHTVFMKGPGMKPELVVLQSEEISGRSLLSPASVCVHPRLIEVRRELEIEIDPDVTADAPDDTSEASGTVEVEPLPDFPSGDEAATP